MDYFEKLNQLSSKKIVSPDVERALRNWYFSYSAAAASSGLSKEAVEKTLVQYLTLFEEEITSPFSFREYHKRIREPFDHYAFGLDFIRPLVQRDRSKIFHRENLDILAEQVRKGENVILLANHQTELDPQAINLLVGDFYPRLAEEMIAVAGHRVVQDPMAIPLSKGCNLLCIYSKKYIQSSEENKEERLLHNQKTMLRMSQLLSEGGKCIYVAPSGGRDRPNADGEVEVAEFDPSSIEFFWLMAQKAEKPTHFYPMALFTYALLPPPDHVEKNLGEPRRTQATPIYLAFGKEIDMTLSYTEKTHDKKLLRKQRAEWICEQVKADYAQFKERP